ncbi:LPS assembly lipoprotein LptE [Halocynthiibacter namhaensis]|uniref:LPS assembly lipoprotein LptE n=1 Tax=Halocynthiibacter namhaensis TaxID=1290553 RepID=UPI0005790112|nr:LPS assembly lipoprotein LptE [Halocynthiibacter namhaensis]
MWLFKRLSLILTVATLTGCGFSPALAPGASGAALPSRIEVMAPNDRDSFDLTRRLEERLGQPTNTLWELSYTLTTSQESVGITPEQVTTRHNIHGQVNYVLTDLASGTSVLEGKIENFTSYAATGNTVSTLSSQRDAHQRLMFIMADQVYARLLLASDQIAQ